jgi:hypothetical protein
VSWAAEDGVPEVGWADGGFWSTADAAWLLDVPVRIVREAVRNAGIEVVGRRFEAGRGTRHVRVYRAEDVLQALGLDDEKIFYEADLQ